MNPSRIIKLIATICFALLIMAIIVAIQNPARGYEMSIYKATPVVVWVVLMLSILAGVGIVLHQVYYRREDTSKLWVMGFLLVSFSFIVLLSVHIFRGYLYYGRADSTSHLTIVRELLVSGHVARENFYPIIHIFMAQLNQVLGLPLTRLFSIVPVLFNALFMSLVFLFCRALLPKKGQVLLASTTGAFVLLAIGYSAEYYGSLHADPNPLADLLMPLVFLLCVRRLAMEDALKVQNTLLFLIMIFFMPPFHVVSAFAVFIMLISLWLPMKLHNLAVEGENRATGEYRFIVPAVIILFVWAISWVTSFYVWPATVKNVYEVITQGGFTWAGQLEERLIVASMYGFDILRAFLRVYYDLIVFGIASLVAFPLLIKQIKNDGRLAGLFSLYGPLISYLLATAIFYRFNIGFIPVRVVRYALLVSAPFLGYVFFELFERLRSGTGRSLLLKAVAVLAALAVLFLSVNGVLKAYPSPYRIIPNEQPTLAEPDGLNWLDGHRGPALGLAVLGIPLERLLPRAEWTKNIDRIPYHFNYPELSKLGDSFLVDRYMVLTKFSRLLYVELFPEMAPYRFYASDFERLEIDPSVDKIYANGGLDVWYINSTTGAD